MLADIKEVLNLHVFSQIFAFQSAFLFASVYFKKNAILKTILFFTILFAIIALVIKYLGIGNMMVVIDEHLSKNALLSPDGVYNGQYLQDIISYVINKYWSIHYLSIVTVFFWVLSYFRLKETEV
jgi:hypothetical protein